MKTRKLDKLIATLDLLKIKVFGNKDYDIIIPFHDVTNKFYLLY